MRVLHVVASLLPTSGGPARTVPRLCEELSRRGADVEIVTLDKGRSRGAPLVPGRDLVRTTFVPCRSIRRLRLLWAPSFSRALRERCRDMGAQIIHDHGVWLHTNHVAAGVSRELGLPLVVTPRGMLTEWAFRYKPWKKRIAWKLYQRSDLGSAKLFHATSDQEADGLQALGLRQSVAVIPNGVDVPARRAPAPRNGPRKLLFLSRINPTKGLLDLVDAWASLRPDGWRVIVAGPDESNYKAVVQEAIRARGLEGAFSFTGSVDGEDKWELYRSADLFVLPTYSESFGVVVAEALACGVPAITTRGAPWQELASERCGWWVEMGVAPLVSALREATALSDEERREMGRRGKALVAKRYSWCSVAEKMVGVYDWLLAGGRPPECVRAL